MSILEELFQEVKENPIDEQVRELCDRITEEEKEEITDELLKLNKMSNVFLCLSASPYYITLERDLPGKYSVGFWRENKRVNSIQIKEINAKKILVEYAKQLKFFRGEL